MSLEAGCAVVCDAVPALSGFPEDEAVFVHRRDTPINDIARNATDGFDERLRNSRHRIAEYPPLAGVLRDLFQTLLASDKSCSAETE
jgi:hypothetical protein